MVLHVNRDVTEAIILTNWFPVPARITTYIPSSGNGSSVMEIDENLVVNSSIVCTSFDLSSDVTNACM